MLGTSPYILDHQLIIDNNQLIIDNNLLIIDNIQLIIDSKQPIIDNNQRIIDNSQQIIDNIQRIIDNNQLIQEEEICKDETRRVIPTLSCVELKFKIKDLMNIIIKCVSKYKILDCKYKHLISYW